MHRVSAPLSLAMNLERPGPPARVTGCDGRRAPDEVLERSPVSVPGSWGPGGPGDDWITEGVSMGGQGLLGLIGQYGLLGLLGSGAGGPRASAFSHTPFTQCVSGGSRLGPAGLDPPRLGSGPVLGSQAPSGSGPGSLALVGIIPRPRSRPRARATPRPRSGPRSRPRPRPRSCAD